MLATKGVNSETPFANVQYLEVYELREGEETYVGSNWKGGELPERTHVMKDGDNLHEYLSSEPVSEVSDASSAPVPDVLDQSGLEESDTQPMPLDSEYEPRIGSRPPPQPYQELNPEWWSPACEMLNATVIGVQHPLIPVSPKDFNEGV
jgi:hypothetical protein